MATRFDSFSGVEMACLVAGLAAYQRTQAYSGNLCPAHGPSPSRDALILEAVNSANFTATSYPDLVGMNLGSGVIGP